MKRLTVHDTVQGMLKGKVLDIGFASNPVYAPKAELFGLDIQNAPLPSGYTETRKANLNTDAIPYPNGFFDMVFAGEVIEHVTNPVRFLTECNRVLKPGGLGILTTPNPYYYRSMLEEFFLSHYKKFDDHHISLFTRYSLRAAAKRARFSLLHEYGTIFRIPLAGWVVSIRRFPLLTVSIAFVLKKEAEFSGHKMMLGRIAGGVGPKEFEVNEKLF